MSANLDRFAQGLPDLVGREVEPVTRCEACGEPIYPGDEYYRTEYGDCCAETECLVKLTRAELREAV